MSNFGVSLSQTGDIVIRLDTHILVQSPYMSSRDLLVTRIHAKIAPKYSVNLAHLSDISKCRPDLEWTLS